MAAPNMNCRLHLTGFHQNSPAFFQVCFRSKFKSFSRKHAANKIEKVKFPENFCNANIYGNLEGEAPPPPVFAPGGGLLLVIFDHFLFKVVS